MTPQILKSMFGNTFTSQLAQHRSKTPEKGAKKIKENGNSFLQPSRRSFQRLVSCVSGEHFPNRLVSFRHFRPFRPFAMAELAELAEPAPAPSPSAPSSPRSNASSGRLDDGEGQPEPQDTTVVRDVSHFTMFLCLFDFKLDG